MFRDKKQILLISLLSIVVIIIIIIIVTSSGTKKITYDKLEDKLIEAAENYYSANSKLLPKSNGDETAVTIKKLVKGEYIKPLEKLVSYGEKCDGRVVVKNIDDKYSYIPYLSCGKYYETIELFEKIINDNEPVTSGIGLYLEGNNYNFKGEVDNNYLKVGKYLWKIMGLTSDGNIKLIYAEKPEKSVYDDRYNTEKENNYGKNIYSISRLYENLNTLVKNEDIFPINFKAKLSKINSCIGARGINDENNSMDIECSETFEDQYATIITVSEYLNASLDKECKNSTNSECQNYNYLSEFNDDSSWWTITPDKDSTHKAYQISSYGVVSLSSCYSLSGIRPIVYLSKDAMYKGGDGSADDPYIIFSSDKLSE